MKIYKNPWVTRESYFVKTGAARSAKMEAAKSTGYSVDFWDGKWKVRKATYYNKSLAEMPVVCENKVSIQAVIGKAVLDAVLGFARAEKNDSVGTAEAVWMPVYESEMTGWDPRLRGVTQSAATFARSVVMRRCMTATMNTFCRIIAPDVGHEWPEGRSDGGAQAQPHGYRCEERRTAAEKEADGHGGE